MDRGSAEIKEAEDRMPGGQAAAQDLPAPGLVPTVEAHADVGPNAGAHAVAENTASSPYRGNSGESRETHTCACSNFTNIAEKYPFTQGSVTGFGTLDNYTVAESNVHDELEQAPIVIELTPARQPGGRRSRRRAVEAEEQATWRERRFIFMFVAFVPFYLALISLVVMTLLLGDKGDPLAETANVTNAPPSTAYQKTNTEYTRGATPATTPKLIPKLAPEPTPTPTRELIPESTPAPTPQQTPEPISEPESKPVSGSTFNIFSG